jgi:hypothetical protein
MVGRIAFVIALALASGASAQSKAPTIPAPTPSPPPRAWIVATSSGDPGVPAAAVVAARAELERVVRACPGLALGPPPAGATAPVYAIDVHVGSMRSSSGHIHAEVALTVTAEPSHHVVAVSSGAVTGTDASLVLVADAAVDAAWRSVPSRLPP